MTVAALTGPFAMLYRPSKRRGSTCFLVSFGVAMAGVMAGSQELDEGVAKSRQIHVQAMGSTSRGENELAVPCRQTAGGPSTDVGNVPHARRPRSALGSPLPELSERE